MHRFAVLDTARSGVANMELDQQMLTLAAEQQTLGLRVYRWSEPTVSLGYFQQLAEFRGQFDDPRPSVVRRATGGGAIVHHHDWTYSLAVPDGLYANRGPVASPHSVPPAPGAAQPLYDCIHDAVVDWLNAANFPAEKYSPGAGRWSGIERDFLCFRRRSLGDVIVPRPSLSDPKVMGSAQRRQRGAVLQHGSLLLGSSPYAPELSGLQELQMDRSGKFADLAVVERRADGASRGVGPAIRPVELKIEDFLRILVLAVEHFIDGAVPIADRLPSQLSEDNLEESRFAGIPWLGRV